MTTVLLVILLPLLFAVLAAVAVVRMALLLVAGTFRLADALASLFAPRL